MSIDYQIYEDGVIAVNLTAVDESYAQSGLYDLAMRYLKPRDTIYKWVDRQSSKRDGRWNRLVYPSASFAYAIGKTLIEQKVVGLDGFNEDDFQKMLEWLIDLEEIHDAMVY